MTPLLTAARPYAQAIFKSAEESGQLAQWLEILNVLSRVVENEQMDSLLTNPKVPPAEIKMIFFDVLHHFLGKTVTAQSKSIDAFLQVLMNAKRLSTLPSIATLYHTLLTQKQGIIEAEVSSPYPLSKDQQEKITALLVKRFDSQVLLKWHEDSSLLGGVVIRVGHWVMDGSIKGRLNQLSENLIA